MDFACKQRTSGSLDYVECVIGPFDAGAVSRAAHMLCEDDERPLLAFYPVSAESWQRVRSATWQTFEERRFMRKGLIGHNEAFWVVGYEQDRATFTDELEWAWHSSTGETLLIVLGPLFRAPLIALNYEDNWEDAEVNDVALLKHFPTVFARAYGGNCVRVSTRRTSEEVRRAFGVEEN